MNTADKVRFAKLITGLAQTFQTPISSGDLENYWQLLKVFPLKAVEQAIIAYCRSPDAHKFLPKPGELVALVQGDSVGQALLAWTKILRAIQSVGAYRSVIFDDPLIQAVIGDMGGWQRLCAMRVQDQPFQAKEFEKRYTHYLARPPIAYPKQLIGIIDAVNAARGHDQASSPILIGDEKRALQVLKGGQDGHQLLSFKPLSLKQSAKLLSTQQSKDEDPL